MGLLVHFLPLLNTFSAGRSPVFVDETGECVTNLAFHHPLGEDGLVFDGDFTFSTGQVGSEIFAAEDFKPAGNVFLSALCCLCSMAEWIQR